jgi:hypothetical protein
LRSCHIFLHPFGLCCSVCLFFSPCSSYTWSKHSLLIGLLSH